ncbi:hypothetical protein [Clostridium hominis]|nr:hypothetical protein [Clostridium hominis]
MNICSLTFSKRNVQQAEDKYVAKATEKYFAYAKEKCMYTT